MNAEFRIDLAEQFPHLAHAPIVEAALQLGTRVQMPWEEPGISAKLKPKLTDYPKVDSLNLFQEEVKLTGGRPSQSIVQAVGWGGLRFRTADEKQIVHFMRDGFLFSRLQRYENWERFDGDAMRLWAFYEEVARPTEILRIGLRFINRIELSPPDFDIDHYVSHGPQLPQGLDVPLVGFLHHDTWSIPGHPYTVRITKTIQPPLAPGAGNIGLILDIDVSTTKPIDLQSERLEKCLAEMRWLKNKVFFGSVAAKALERLQ